MNDMTQISITGKLKYSDEITISQAAQIIAFLNSDERQTAELGKPLLTGSNPSKESTIKKVGSAREALDISGATKNPDWYYNLKSTPDITVEYGSDTFEATLTELPDDEGQAKLRSQAAMFIGHLE